MSTSPQLRHDKFYIYKHAGVEISTSPVTQTNENPLD